MAHMFLSKNVDHVQSLPGLYNLSYKECYIISKRNTGQLFNPGPVKTNCMNQRTGNSERPTYCPLIVLTS